MASGRARSTTLDPVDAGPQGTSAPRRAVAGRWARAAIVAQAAFVVCLLAAPSWQGPHYSALADSISDMSAVTAPGGLFLVDVFTVCGAAALCVAGAASGRLAGGGRVDPARFVRRRSRRSAQPRRTAGLPHGRPGMHRRPAGVQRWRATRRRRQHDRRIPARARRVLPGGRHAAGAGMAGVGLAVAVRGDPGPRLHRGGCAGPAGRPWRSVRALGRHHRRRMGRRTRPRDSATGVRAIR